jgi:uncharacterized protein with beta-barrel porin domain
MRGALKPFAFLAALIPVVAPKGALAETLISTATTAPVQTSTANDDLRIDSGGSIKPTASGPAVTLNSDDSVTNQGAIAFNNVDNATGILVDASAAARAGDVTNSGTINLIEDYTSSDSDGDGDPDGAYAQGAGRFGVRVSGANMFTGDIVQDSAGSIAIEGNNSAGVEIDGPMTGDLKIGGGLSILGDNSYGIRTTGNIVGDFRFTGSISSRGHLNSAVSVEGDVSGVVQLQGSIVNTGFRFDSRPTDDVIAKLDSDDTLLGGPAVSIKGDLGGGLLFDAPPADLDTTNADEDGDGTPDASESTSSISQSGSAPAVQIGDSGGAAIALTNVGTGDLAYGVVNKGSITAVGILDAIPTTAMRIENANLNGGLSSTGSMIAGSFHADTSVLSIGAGSTLGAINNTGLMQDNLVTDQSTPTGRVVLIESGASVPALNNTGTMTVSITGAAAKGVAIEDQLDALHAITNTGTISVTHTSTDPITGAEIAFDLHNQTTGTTITQATPASSTAAAPAIIGDILFGGGADKLDVQDGSVKGDISFGAGADQLLISGGSSVSGALSDSDGDLAINVSDGALTLTNTGNVTVSSLDVGATSNLFLTLDPVSGNNGQITVNGPAGATFAGGSKVSVLLTSAIPGAAGVTTPFTLITTTGGGAINGTPPVALEDAPFLYTPAVTSTATTIDLSLTRKTAAQLGLNRNETAFYEPFFQTALGDASLMQSILGAGTSQTFHDVFGQAMPNATGAQVEFAQTRSQALTNLLFSRYLGPKKPDREIYAWAHEITYSRDRDATVEGQGYDGFGFGFALGLDGPMGRTGYKGIGLSLTSDEINEKAGVDQPFTVTSAELSTHVVQPIGGLVIGGRLGAAYDVFRSKRHVEFTPDLSAPALSRAPKADWVGGHVSASLHAAYPTHLGFISVRPEAGIDAVAMWEQGYEEAGGGTGLDLAIDSRQTTRANASATVAFGLPFQRNGFIFTPELTVGARAPLLKDPYETSGHFVSAASNTFALESDVNDSAALIAGLALNVDGQIGSFRLEGQAESSDGELTATGRLVLRLTF